MVIMLLLLFLGIAVGSNREVVTRFASLGLEALLLTLGGTLGSLIAALWLYRKVLHGPKGASHQSENTTRKRDETDGSLFASICCGSGSGNHGSTS